VTGALLAAAAGVAVGLPRVVVVAGAGCVLLLAVAGVVGRQGVTFPKRQTYGGAVNYSGERLGQAIWGFDLALGFSTYRTSRLYWGALILLVVGGSPVFCAAGALTYAATFLVAVRRGKHFVVREDWMIRRRRRLGILGVVVATGLLAVTGLPVVAGG
jgi:hypothetical protein